MCGPQLELDRLKPRRIPKHKIAAITSIFLMFCLLLAMPTASYYIRPGVNFKTYLTTASNSYEITAADNEVLTYADVFDEEKGGHSYLSYSEGSEVNLNARLSNDLGISIDAQIKSAMRIKEPGESWNTLWSDDRTGTVAPNDSEVGQSDILDFTSYGFWQVGTKLHLGVWIKQWPTTDPSSYVINAWTLWLTVVSDSEATTPGNGNGGSNYNDGGSNNDGSGGTTTTNPGTDTVNYNLDSMLGFLQPLAAAFGTTTTGLIFYFVLLLLVFVVLIYVLNDRKK